MASAPGLELDEATRGKLAAALAKSGLSQVALGEACGVNSQTINQVLSGARRPSEDLLQRICTALGLRCEIETRIKITRAPLPRRG